MLTMCSKAWWGYDEAFLQDAAEELRHRPEFFPEGWVYMLCLGDEIVAFCSLRRISATEVELSDLFVHPSWIGKGCGKRLWLHALQVARDEGFEHLVLNADPHAEAFYAKLGAVRIGEVPSGIRPGRMLPVMYFSLSGVQAPPDLAGPKASAC